MKLIALKDFANNIEGLEISGAQHPQHVHKGATFEIGAAKEFKNLSKADQILVGQLAYAGCIGDANDQKVVQRVAEELAVDKKREAAAAKPAPGK